MEQWAGGSQGKEGRKHPVNLCRVECECALESGGLGQLLPQSSASIGQVSRNVVSMMTTDATKVNRAKTSKAKTSLVVLLVLCLLTEGYAKTTLSLPTRYLDR